MTNRIRGYRALIDQFGEHVTVACDTEFKGPHTLTAQLNNRGTVTVSQPLTIDKASAALGPIWAFHPPR